MVIQFLTKAVREHFDRNTSGKKKKSVFSWEEGAGFLSQMLLKSNLEKLPKSKGLQA